MRSRVASDEWRAKVSAGARRGKARKRERHAQKVPDRAAYLAGRENGAELLEAADCPCAECTVHDELPEVADA